MEFTEEQRLFIVNLLNYDFSYKNPYVTYYCHYCFRKLWTKDVFSGDCDYDDEDYGIDNLAFTCKCGCVEFACNDCYEKHCDDSEYCDKIIDKINDTCLAGKSFDSCKDEFGIEEESSDDDY